MATIKTYVLLEDRLPDVPMYRQVSPNDRIRLKYPPIWRPLLQVTFSTQEGKNVTLRLKTRANTIWQEDQVKEGFEANQKFDTADYAAVTFRFGVLVTGSEVVQKMLEAHPQYDKFDGVSDEVKWFKLLDKKADAETEYQIFEEQLKAAEHIRSLDKEGARNLLLSIHGATYEAPVEEKDMKLELIRYLNDSETGPADILKDRGTLDDTVRLLTAKAVTAGILSFDKEQGQVVMKRNKKWVPVKDVPATMSVEEKIDYFNTFVASTDGKLLKSDLTDLLDKGAES